MPQESINPSEEENLAHIQAWLKDAENLEAMQQWLKESEKPEKKEEEIAASDMVVLTEESKAELSNPESDLAKRLAAEGVDPKELQSWCTVVGVDPENPGLLVVASLGGKAVAQIPRSALRKVSRGDYEAAQEPYKRSSAIHGRDIQESR